MFLTRRLSVQRLIRVASQPQFQSATNLCCFHSEGAEDKYRHNRSYSKERDVNKWIIAGTGAVLATGKFKIHLGSALAGLSLW